MRGCGYEADSNFMHLMKLRGVDDARLQLGYNKSTNRYTVPDMQNEILKIMPLLILRGVVDIITIAPF